MTAPGGDVVFRIALRTVFKAKTKVALFAVTVIIFQHALAASSEMLDQRTVRSGLAPERISEATGWTKHLYRHVVCTFLRRADFRGKQIVWVSGIVKNQAVSFTLVQPQPASDDLLIQTDRLRRTQDGNHIHMGRIEPGC